MRPTRPVAPVTSTGRPPVAVMSASPSPTERSGCLCVPWSHQNVTELQTQLGNHCYSGTVTEPVGLRARKKVRTRDAIADAAISLFLAHGFDHVSVSDIAATAEVSKPTLFRYFATKEDLVLHRFMDHNGEAARVVRDRRPDVAPIAALHRHFRAGLDRFEPVTGLNDHPEVVAFHRLVFSTPSLAGRLTQYMLDDEDALAAALDPGIAGPTASRPGDRGSARPGPDQLAEDRRRSDRARCPTRGGRRRRPGLLPAAPRNGRLLSPTPAASGCPGWRPSLASLFPRPRRRPRVASRQMTPNSAGAWLLSRA